MWKRINKFILGKTRGSFSEIRKSLLVGYYAIICISGGLVYLSFYIYWGLEKFLPWYLSLFSIIILAFLLNRSGRRNLAVYILFPTINLYIYFFASSESYTTAVYLLYAVTCFGGFVLFGANELVKPILFTVYTFVLFIISYWVDFSILPYRDFPEATLKVHLALNFSAMLLISILIIHILNQINRHQENEILEKNFQLIKTNDELDQFVYSTSHDLRAPLSSVMGLLYIAQHSKDFEETRLYLDLMDKRVRSLEKFIRDITDYSRNNRVEIKEEQLVLKELLDEVWESLRYSPEAQNISLRINFNEDMIITCDRARLRIVLSNLISNALRYHDLSKQDRFVRINAYPNGEFFFLEVGDNGQDILPEYKHRIFDMFFRANEKSNGSGLGLYIVKETLNKLSGLINVNSQINKGSIFTVQLPYHAKGIN